MVVLTVVCIFWPLVLAAAPVFDRRRRLPKKGKAE